MKRKSPSKSPSKAASVSRRAFSAGLGAVGFTAGIAPFNIVVTGMRVNQRPSI